MKLEKFVNDMEDALVEFEEYMAEHQDRHGGVDTSESDWMDMLVQFINNGDVEF